MATSRRNLSTFEIDAILQRIARPQLGLVTVAAAAAEGVDGRALARRRDSGALVPVFAKVMRLGAVDPSPAQRILAAALAVPGFMIGATSAAVIQQMPVGAVGHIGERPTVVVEAHRSARTAGVNVLRASHPLPSLRWCTARLTTPAATLLLLPRFLDRATVERCVDHSLAHRLVSVWAVHDLIDRLPPPAVVGRGMLLELLAQRSSGIGHRSRLEQTVARWLDDADLRGWQRNYRVPTGCSSVEVDFGWPAHKVALEVSPFFTHGSRANQERDAERRKLLVVAGWRLVEATDPDLEYRRAFDGVAASLATLLSSQSQASCAMSVAGRHGAHKFNIS
jgi:very-short-patch-repair endonuclease